MKERPSLEADLKVMFLDWASQTMSVVAKAEASHDPELARSIRSLAERTRAMAAAIAAREGIAMHSEPK